MILYEQAIWYFDATKIILKSGEPVDLTKQHGYHLAEGVISLTIYECGENCTLLYEAYNTFYIIDVVQIAGKLHLFGTVYKPGMVYELKHFSTISAIHNFVHKLTCGMPVRGTIQTTADGLIVVNVD